MENNENEHAILCPFSLRKPKKQRKAYKEESLVFPWLTIQYPTLVIKVWIFKEVTSLQMHLLSVDHFQSSKLEWRNIQHIKDFFLQCDVM